MSDTPLLWQETVPPVATWSHVLKRATSLRITDLEGGATTRAFFSFCHCPVARQATRCTLTPPQLRRFAEAFVVSRGMGCIMWAFQENPMGWNAPAGAGPTPRPVASKYRGARYKAS